jgi:hypothetical protein
MSFIADPVLAVMVDELVERGAKLDVWTDEEAERCRLVAFHPFTRHYDLTRHAPSSRIESTMVSPKSGERWWFWNFVIIGQSQEHTIERGIHAFAQPDFALGVSVTPELARVMSKGRRLPKKFRPIRRGARAVAP